MQAFCEYLFHAAHRARHARSNARATLAQGNAFRRSKARFPMRWYASGPRVWHSEQSGIQE